MSETGLESLLKSFGLTEYESRAYVTLLSLGTSTAEQLSRQGKIPLPRVYDTLTELQRKGFVLISKARPKKFNPIAVDKALNNFLSNQKKEFDEKMSHLKDIIPEVKKNASGIPKGRIKESKWNIWSFDRMTNIDRILDEQKIQAKKDVLIFSGDMSWMLKIPEIVKKMAKKGIRMRVIATDPKGKPQVAKNIKAAKNLGLKVKSGYEGIVRGHVVDGVTASISFMTSAKGMNIAGKGLPGSEKEKSYEMITTNNPVLVSILKENFEFWWNRLK